MRPSRASGLVVMPFMMPARRLQRRGRRVKPFSLDALVAIFLPSFRLVIGALPFWENWSCPASVACGVGGPLCGAGAVARRLRVSLLARVVVGW